ncbi:sulfurtransferase [Subsaxibacter sp. CAU 1640]|uniref:sulfurtransferase n=1 Tax=Subsaxibacter sp. CAU 1640 TaxID=2933271 RepID=UPI00200337CC|nr:sulfurtransferase [Subsaxibacter sp. CAU 1640]MCK7590091.1 sulfurtransferase [Subsaxibacter sp. CAU 1640]
MEPIATTKWLKEHLHDPNLIILDASTEGSADGSKKSDRTEMIPCARWFDLKGVFSDATSVFPNTLPTVAQFEEGCQNLGISNHHKIVIYDHFGVYSSPRVWWLFKVMGHKSVAVLDGGLPEWKAQGYKTVPTMGANYYKGNFKANFQPELIIKLDDVKDNIKHPDFLIVDARSSGRFNGTESEPRAHLKSGHIPNSVNIPYQEVLDGTHFKDKSTLKDLFNQRCYGKKNLVFSCGSGLTACIVMLASNLSYSDSQRIYDGSWTEWAQSS